MTTEIVKTRFAPSPTGYLHLGNVRTALFNTFLARRRGGQFLLRIEDTDRERSRPEYVAALLEDLHWLGLDWQEGPEVGGARGPYAQSERAAIYADYYQRLETTGQAYPCFCTPAELALSRKAQLSAGRPPRYAGTCARLSEAERCARLERGLQPTLRNGAVRAHQQAGRLAWLGKPHPVQGQTGSRVGPARYDSRVGC